MRYYPALLLELVMTPTREPRVPASSSWDLAKHGEQPRDCPKNANGHHTLVDALDGRVFGFVLDHVEIL